MNLRQRIANFIAPTAKNAADVNLAREFLRHGNRRQLLSNWSAVSMSDRDMYTGYMFGALDERANTVVELAEGHLKTKASQTIMYAAKASGEVIEHPYMPIIDASDFVTEDLWYNYSTFVDLEGMFYLMAVRNIGRKSDGSLATVGKIQYFKLLNPYNIVPVRNEVTKEIGGYTEYRNGQVRDIPLEMVIAVRRLNPFSETDGYAIADAAKDDQFTLKSAKDYTNHSLAGNINAPGIISTGAVLSDPDFQNFRSRILNHEKGEPLFGNGSGKIDWKSMQADLEKAALEKVNEISLTGIIASTRVSKTSLGIEQSGVTRETSKVQDDRLIGKVGIPQLRRLIGALNQDYRKYYTSEYQKTQYCVYIDNPLKTDREAELKDSEVRQKNFDLYTSLVDRGYPADLAAQYAAGEITLGELGEPSKPEKPAEEPNQSIRSRITHRLTVPDGSELCQCCLGRGEHITGFECYRCDASGSVTEEEELQPIPCDGREDSPEVWIDEDGNYRHAEERSADNGNPYHGPDGRFTTGSTRFTASTKRQATKYINDNYGDIDYSDDEKSAVSNYTSSMFARINRTLRDDTYAEIPLYKKNTAEHIKLIDSAMKKMRLKEGVVAYRGSSTDRRFKVGDVIKDKGYSSTSLLPKPAKVFIGQAFVDRGYRFVMKINASKGKRGVFAELSGRDSGESELILPRSSSFRVTKVTKKKGYYEAEVDLL